MTETLILSVGGSAQPLRKCIESRRWDRVIFVVSAETPRSKSSRSQVEDLEITYVTNEGKKIGPGLRHLPACPDDIDIIEVPPDDLDRALAPIDAALAAELARGAEVTINYTGGTKTMTAALVLAGSAHEHVRLQLIAGERHGLEGTTDGTEAPVEMSGELLGLARLFATAEAFTKTRNYAAAASVMRDADATVAQARLAVPPGWRERIALWRGWLEILEAWDRFRHGKAWDLCGKALRAGGPLARALEAAGIPERIKPLAEAKGKPSAFLVEDLWLNALRRADLGLWDDAMARLYRLAEAAVQTRLWTKHGIETGAVPWQMLTEAEREGLRPNAGADEVQTAALPLSRALAFFARLAPEDPVVKAWERGEDGRFRDPKWQGGRNHSILAHGFEALGETDWRKAQEWFDARRGPFWEELLGRPTAPQLPDSLP